MRNTCILILALFITSFLNAQMDVDGNTLYGNEWINFNDEYHLDIKVESKGMYQITFQDLRSAGIPEELIIGNDIHLLSYGKLIPIHVSAEGTWGQEDYLLFYGEANDGWMDQFMFAKPETEQLNPYVSMFNDVRTYVLRIREGATFNSRYDKIENDLTGQLPAQEQFYIAKANATFKEQAWNPTVPNDPFIHFSHFVAADGFATRFRASQTQELELLNFFSSGPDPRLVLRTGSNKSEHRVQILVNNNPVINDVYQSTQVKQYDEEFSKGFLRDQTNYIKVIDQGVASALGISYIDLYYPRRFDANNQGSYEFSSPDDNFRAYIEIPKFNPGALNFVFDLENRIVLEPELDGNTAKFVLPSRATKASNMIIVNEDALQTPLSIERINLLDLRSLNPEFLILTHKDLNKVENGRNLITEYKDFRSSELGGGYKTAVINIHQIINQFGYGVEGHSYAIRNFSNFIQQHWPDFQMVCIMGKALSFANKDRNTEDVSFVPTYGRPGSDNLLFARPGKYYPEVAVGRVAVQSQQDLITYLEKAKINASLSDVSNLSIEDRIWLKNVLHLSGGDVNIQEQIYSALNQMANLIENNQYGANVTTFRKNSTDPVTTALTESILNQIDSGLSLMTFFGHSSAGTFDFSVEDPTAYQNYGRHPIVLSMGCHSGDIHEPIFSLSEKFILTPEVGAIAFIASAGNAYLEPLRTEGLSFYNKIGTDFYGKPIGLSVRQYLEEEFTEWENRWLPGPQTQPLPESRPDVFTLLEQNTIHGDPAITFFKADAPDFVVDLPSFETMDQVGSGDESIALNFNIINLGLGIDQDSLNNMLIHTYGNNQVDTIYFRSIAPKNRELVELMIPNPGEIALGKNSINVILDIDNAINEMPDPIAEDNNDMMRAWNSQEGYCFFIFDNGVKPIYPAEFGIAFEENLTLLAGGPNALGRSKIYQIQIDTAETFDSAALISEEISSSPSLIKWQPAINWTNERVYYWRVKLKDDPQAIWSNSSFVYLEEGAPGWNQSHYYQWTKDEFGTSLMSPDSRKFEFIQNIIDVRIKNNVYGDSDIPSITYQNNPTEYLPFGGEVTAGVYLASFDGSTGEAWVNDASNGGEFGSQVASPWVEGFICYPYYTNTTEWREKAINFIENEVPEGNYVALFTIQRENEDYSPQDWASDNALIGTDLMSILEGYGAQYVRTLEDEALPYIFVFKKNDNTFTPIEKIAANKEEKISLEMKIDAKWFEGDISSTLVGPAVKWDKMLWDLDRFDEAEDSYKFDIYGVQPDGTETLLHEAISEFEFDLSQIDAAQYPHLRLRFYSKDEVSRSAANMKYWRILYQDLPDVAYDFDESFVFNDDTLNLGDLFKFEAKATNVSDFDMDSLLVRYTITDMNNEQYTEMVRLAPIKARESLDLSFSFNTEDIVGVNEFLVELNSNKEQEEEYYFNNLGIRSFLVEGDNTNPILDVTFDGVRIMDGDYISATPLIVAILKDENQNSPISDVSSFDLALQKLPDNQSYPIDLMADNVSFFPADSSNNYCARVEILEELETGTYVLFVQGKDAAGNLSGDVAYSVTFEVVAETSITNVLNYPNPFSTSTEFVYTITGNEIPEVFTIQIMTISGKVVKEITKEELGNVRIGQNRSSYKWDGTDEFGSKLANGVYLYRVITSNSDGEAIDKLQISELDSYFKKGFGKLVIMR